MVNAPAAPTGRFHAFVRSGLVVLMVALAALYVPRTGHAQSGYFFPEDVRFDPDIPAPAAFLGYDIGSHHTRHDRIVAYFRELARRSDRITVTEIGQTNEHRPMIYAIVTTPENHNDLDALRQQHLRISDPDAAVNDLDDQPLVVQLGYGVHGDETSSSEVAMLQAYYLVAGQNETIDRYLREGIFLIEPVLNPDGRDRHTHWANMHKGDPLVADPLDREHNEVWPSGRTNHYWFDLNRDWFPLTQVESRARVDFYHEWMPNVVTDYHEMGAGNTYFFEPTEPESSWDPVVPEEVYTDLTAPFAERWSQALDELGTLYFTKEIYDNSYPGYGSTYPNLQGGIGFVFEQASARGHVQETDTRELTFAYTIRNQLRTSLATVETALERKQELLSHQRDFFTSALEEADAFPADAYVFGDPHDASRTRAFLDLLLRHRIEVYELNDDYTVGGESFEAGSAYVVPTRQPQYRMVRSIFETVTEFSDSTFYDTSAWSLALSYGLPHAEVQGEDVPQGERVTSVPSRADVGSVDRSTYAYVLDWSDYHAPKALYALQQHDVVTKTAFEPFELVTASGPHAYPRGSILIPVQPQTISADSLHRLVERAEARAEVNIHSTSTGFARDGKDLGSPDFRAIDAPQALLLVGDGISGYEAGQVWHALDDRVDMPITKVDRTDYDRVPLYDYDTLVLVSGRYGFRDAHVDEIRRWLRSGGTLITIREASAWAIEADLVTDSALVDADTRNGSDAPSEEDNGEQPLERHNFADADDVEGAQQIGGSIYEVDLDTTHPLGFGYHRRSLPVYRDHRIFLPPTDNPYSTVARYTDDPHLSGYVSDENLETIRNSASLLVDQVGRGRIILFADNPNFRGMWYGTNKLFFNALFFGPTIYAP